ncbi:MAG: sigma-70 family RNA polymerase sigma factor [bacterium]
MRKATDTRRDDRGCDVCGESCVLSERQHECYRDIPDEIDPVWHDSFDDPAAKRRYFGDEARAVEAPRWTLFPEVPEDADRNRAKRSALSKDDEAELFLRYNYARCRLSRLAERQQRRPSKFRARAMLAWHDRARAVRSQLVSANMGLVVAMAKRTRIPNVSFSDLISEGYMALLRAIDNFDVARGFKFSTYACRAILKGFNRLATKVGRYVSRFGVSYDPELEPSDYDVRRHEMQRDMAVSDVQEVLARNSARLDPIERTVVVERFALDGRDKPGTLAEVGEHVGLSNERVRQVQKRALAKMRATLAERGCAGA